MLKTFLVFGWVFGVNKKGRRDKTHEVETSLIKISNLFSKGYFGYI